MPRVFVYIAIRIVVVPLPLVARRYLFIARRFAIRTGRKGRPRLRNPVVFAKLSQFPLFL